MENNDDEILRLYSRLNSMKSNLSSEKEYQIRDVYIAEYNSSINKLAEITSSPLDEFTIPESEMKHIQTGGHYNNNTDDIVVDYSNEKYCNKTYFFNKLDALLTYFSFKYVSNEKPVIGFKNNN